MAVRAPNFAPPPAGEPADAAGPGPVRAAAPDPLGNLGRLPPELLVGSVLAEAALEPGFLRRFAQVSRQASVLALGVAEHALRKHHLQQVENLLRGAAGSALTARRAAVPALPAAVCADAADELRAVHAAAFLDELAASSPLQVGCEALLDRAAERAEDAFRTYLVRDPEHAGALVGLAQALRLQDKLEPAAAVCRRALKTRPDDLELQLTLADVLRRQGRLEPAMAGYLRALDLRQNDGRVWLGLAGLARARGDDDALIAALQQALIFGAPSAARHHLLGAALQRQGQLAAAVRHYRTATQLFDRPETIEEDEALGGSYRPRDAWLGLGVLSMAFGQRDVARSALNNALALLDAQQGGQEDADVAANVHTALAQLHADARDFVPAVRHATLAATLQPNDVDTHLYLANVLHLAGRHHQAREVLLGSPQLLAHSLEANLLLGTLLRREGAHLGAELAYRRAVRLSPDDGTASLGLGQALLALHRHGEAETSLRRSVALLPKSAEAALALSELELACQRPGAAEASAQRAVELEPSLEATWLALAAAQVAQQRLPLALHTLNQALSLHPRGMEAVRMERAQLQQMVAPPTRDTAIGRLWRRLRPPRRR